MTDELAPTPTPTDAAIAAQRARLFALAYRMLGSVAEAEDIVQDAFLRLHRAEEAGVTIASRPAYLATVTTRLAIDHLRSARARRETYVGPWLPEPLVDWHEPDAARQVELAESLSVAFLLILETLSPVERAVFLLREVFDYDYADIATIVEKSEANCRQIFARARRHVDARKPRFTASRAQRDELTRRFFNACLDADVDGIVRLLAADATFTGDGGGKSAAAIQPVLGADRVARFLRGLFAKGRALGVTLRLVEVNGDLGAMTLDADGRIINVFTLESSDDGIVAVRSVVNPDKLQHLGPVSDVARLRPRTP